MMEEILNYSFVLDDNFLFLFELVIVVIVYYN